jgi:hypothetical protein
MKGIIMCKIVLALFFVIFCLLNISCVEVTEGPAPAVKVSDSKAPYTTIRYDNVVFIDRSLQKWPVEKGRIFSWPVDQEGKKGKIAVESQGSRRTQTNTLEVWATLRNRTNYPLQLEGRVQFFDSSKVPIEGPTAWQRIFLPPNSIEAYKEKSTRVDIAHYYIEIREGR